MVPVCYSSTLAKSVIVLWELQNTNMIEAGEALHTLMMSLCHTPQPCSIAICTDLDILETQSLVTIGFKLLFARRVVVNRSSSPATFKSPKYVAEHEAEVLVETAGAFHRSKHRLTLRQARTSNCHKTETLCIFVPLALLDAQSWHTEFDSRNSSHFEVWTRDRERDHIDFGHRRAHSPGRNTM